MALVHYVLEAPIGKGPGSASKHSIFVALNINFQDVDSGFWKQVIQALTGHRSLVRRCLLLKRRSAPVLRKVAIPLEGSRPCTGRERDRVYGDGRCICLPNTAGIDTQGGVQARVRFHGVHLPCLARSMGKQAGCVSDMSSHIHAAGSGACKSPEGFAHRVVVHAMPPQNASNVRVRVYR